MHLTTLYYYLLEYCICMDTGKYFIPFDAMQNFNFPQLIIKGILHLFVLFVSMLLIYSIIN